MSARRALVTLLFLLLATPPVWAQQGLKTGTITTAGADCSTATTCVFLSGLATANGSIQITGTWTGTLQFEATIDSTTWVALNATPLNSTSAATNTTGNGAWSFSAPLHLVRVRASALSSGSAVVTILVTAARMGGSGGAGGGGGGTVTSVDVAVPGQELTTSGGPIASAGTITLGRRAVNAVGNITGPTTYDWNTGQTFSATLTGDVTFTLSNPANGTTYTAILTQDGSGAHAVTWPAAMRWPGGVTPTVNSAAGSVTEITFMYDGTNYTGFMNHWGGATLSAARGGTGVTDLTFAGNTHKVGTTTGSLTSGNCVKIDVNGNFVDNGAVCASGAGGSNTQVMFNDTGVLNGDATFTFDKTNKVVTVPGLAVAMVTKSADYTLTQADYMVCFDTTGALRTATLPTAATKKGMTVAVKNCTGSNNVTVARSSTDTIDGLASQTLRPLESVILISDGVSVWSIF